MTATAEGMLSAAVQLWQSSRQAWAGLISYNYLNTFSAVRQPCSNLLPASPDRLLVRDYNLALDQLRAMAAFLHSVTWEL